MPHSQTKLEAKVLAKEFVKATQALGKAERRLAEIRVIIEGLRGHEDEYSIVESQLEEIERILDA